MMKKRIALLLVAALVITSLNFAPSPASASQSDAEGYDWSTVSWLSANAECSEYADTYKMVIGQGNANIDVIQNPGFATEKGVYVTFSDADFGDITLNDVTTSAYDIQGAGIIFHVSMFKEKYNSLVIKNSAGGVKAELYVYYKNAASEETTESGEQTDPNAIAAPTDVAGYNFYAQGNGYMITFTAVENAVSYNVYMDNSGVLATVTKSGEYVAASTFSAYADGELHSLYLCSVDAEGNISA